MVKRLLDIASDGCHKWGWIINLITMLAMFSYLVGSLDRGMEDLKERVIRLESQVYDLAHITRGNDPDYEARKNTDLNIK